MFTTLKSARLHFRQFRESDFDAQMAVFNDPLTISIYGELTAGEIWRRIAMALGHWQLRGYGPFALEHRETGAYVGACSLWFPQGWQDIEIGYHIAPQFRRQGFAAEAVRRIREHGYKDRGFDKLVSYIQPSNLASQAVARSVGAIADGEFDMSGKLHIVFVHPKH
jgi:RimJ/RimL family protein N-acetyltransferase